MGSGAFTLNSFIDYSFNSGKLVDRDTGILDTYGCFAQDMFKSRKIDKDLDPYNVSVRECVDSEEHPNTIPVILALDVTGSMGSSAVEVAKKLGVIMTDLYQKVKDVEFCIMGIGDVAYDKSPLQVSQFESDIRIAEQLDKIYFEGGGGGNSYESYTLSWYFGLNKCKLDCWNRGKKGIIITMGDELLNPYIPVNSLEKVFSQVPDKDIETKELYDKVKDKFDIYHIMVNHGYFMDTQLRDIRNSWINIIPEQHYMESKLEELSDKIVDIVTNHREDKPTNDGGMISW